MPNGTPVAYSPVCHHPITNRFSCVAASGCTQRSGPICTGAHTSAARQGRRPVDGRLATVACVTAERRRLPARARARHSVVVRGVYAAHRCASRRRVALACRLGQRRGAPTEKAAPRSVPASAPQERRPAAPSAPIEDLRTPRQRLADQHWIDHAKAVLIDQGATEALAHQALRRLAMDRRISLAAAAR